MTAFSALLLALSLAACEPAQAPAEKRGTPPPPAPAWDGAPEGPRVQVVVDLTHPETRKMDVTLYFTGLTDAMWSFRTMGVEPELLYTNVRFSTPDGTVIDAERNKRVFKLAGDEQADLVVQYTVEPGGDGRHGHQGTVNSAYASFDGRIFILPNSAGGLRAARVRFDRPDAWTIAGALPVRDGWVYADVYGPDKVLTALSESCWGVGPFEENVRTFGQAEVKEYHLRSWPQDTRDKLRDNSFGIYQWFHESLGFDPGFPMAVVWTPDLDGGRVYGGSSANGTCMEQPVPRDRPLQLLAHRIGHSMNKYVPSGMQIRDDRDQWFKEGWASYIELMATTGSGVAGGSRWNHLFNTYHDKRRKKPEEDLAMIDEHKARGDSREYMHYFKSPVVVMILDDWIQRRYGKDLTGFWKAMYAEYGAYKKPLPLREELDAWVGGSLDDFWALHVDQRGFLYPVWKEHRTPAVELAAAKPGAATVAGRAISGDYLYHLASTGDFARFADVAAFLENEEARRVQLAAAGVQLLPPFLEEVRTGLSPETRYSLAQAEALYPLIDRPKPLPDGKLVLSPDDPDARLFATLLEHEARYEATIGGSGIGGITVQRLGPVKGEGEDAKAEYVDKPILTFTAMEKVRMQATWDWRPGKAQVRVHRDGVQTDQREIAIAPEWTRSWSELAPEQRPTGAGIVSIEVTGESGQPVTRSYWQRAR